MKKEALRKKIKIARFATRLFELIPYHKMTALCNSVAEGVADEDSDIDLFIIARNKHIYTVRYLAVFILTVFGLKSRPREGNTANKICLSIILNSSNLNLDRLNSNSKEEKLRANWIKNIVPLYDDNHTYLDFIDKNSWVKKYYPKYYSEMLSKTKDIKTSWFFFLVKKIFEIILFFGIGWVVEKIVRSIQIKRLYRFKHKHVGREKMLINDQIIKLHFLPKNDHKELF